MGNPRRRIQIAPLLALGPGWLIFLIVFVGCTVFSVILSFTSSSMLPNFNFVGFQQYERLFANARFLQSTLNLAIYGPLVIILSLALGLLLAILVDQKVRAEGIFRSLYLYPHALSFIVTGHLWRWFFDPDFGFETQLAYLGLPQTGLKWLSDPDVVIFTLVIAAVWHSAGLVMVILLARLRVVDQDIWKATRIEGIPAWRTYLSIIIPMLSAAMATCFVLLSLGVIKVYDLVVAMTGGGPGFASDMPAKFVLDNFFERQQVGLGSAGVVMMLLTVIIIFAPVMFARSIRARRQRSREA